MLQSRLLITIVLMFSGLSVQANGLLCSDLFSKSYRTAEFAIGIQGKKQSEIFLELAHSNLTSNFEASQLFKILKVIKKNGVENLTREERKFIIKFRQDSSFLRSIFQTSDKDHKSPNDFAKFVRDFGVLKDYLLMKDSAGAQAKAKDILKKHKNLDFEALLKDVKPASKKSVKKYFKSLIEDSKRIMARPTVTVDEIHDVRKNLRDILRFMQMQNEVEYARTSGSKQYNLGQDTGLQDTPQIEFMKKTNQKLGEICDDFAAQILRGEIDEDTVVTFPEKIRPRVDHFLLNTVIHVED